MDESCVEIKFSCECINGVSEKTLLDVLFTRAEQGISPIWPISWTMLTLCYPHLTNKNKTFWARNQKTRAALKDFLHKCGRSFLDMMINCQTWARFADVRRWAQVMCELKHLPITKDIEARTCNDLPHLPAIEWEVEEDRFLFRVFGHEYSCEMQHARTSTTPPDHVDNPLAVPQNIQHWQRFFSLLENVKDGIYIYIYIYICVCVGVCGCVCVCLCVCLCVRT